MKNISNIKIKYLTTSEKLEKAHKSDSGYDVKSAEEYILISGETKKIKTGVYIELPNNVEIQLRPKSSLSEKGILVHLGTIDSGYRGEIQIVITNLSDKNIKIEKGQKAAQLIFSKILNTELIEVEEIDTKTERGCKGFGSTGKF